MTNRDLRMVLLAEAVKRRKREIEELEAIWRLPSPVTVVAEPFQDLVDDAERQTLGFFARWRWRLRR